MASTMGAPRAAAGARTVVIGGSISGLVMAIALARIGVEVEVLERDRPPESAIDGVMDGWWRRGAPQARHSHSCVALGRKVLRERAPDVWESLLAAGAREVPGGARLTTGGGWLAACDDHELVALACRRPLLEAVVRRCAREYPGVWYRDGIEVTGLLTAHGDPPVVTGVATGDGDRAADLVIDASGRASGLLAWLRDIGGRPPLEEAENCGILYFSRFYQLRAYPDVTLNRGPASGGIGPSTACVAIPGDHDTVQVTVGVPPGDAALRAVGRNVAFEAVARLHPPVAPWLAPGVSDPISEVAPMAGLENRLRRFVIDGRPIVRGLLPVGDAACITDPAFGRGMSLGIAHAFALADAIASGIDDLDQVALQADDLTGQLLRPWFDDAVSQDRGRTARWVKEPPGAPGPGVTLNDIALAATQDQRAWRAAIRRFNLLDHPDAIFADNAIATAVNEARHAGIKEVPLGPAREHVVETLASL